MVSARPLRLFGGVRVSCFNKEWCAFPLALWSEYLDSSVIVRTARLQYPMLPRFLAPDDSFPDRNEVAWIALLLAVSILGAPAGKGWPAPRLEGGGQPASDFVPPFFCFTLVETVFLSMGGFSVPSALHSDGVPF